MFVDHVIEILPSGATVAQNWNKPVSTGGFRRLTPDNTWRMPPAGNCGPAPVFAHGAGNLFAGPPLNLRVTRS